MKNARRAADIFDRRPPSAFLVLLGAIAADAQVVTEVKAGDQLIVEGVGEVRLLGVDALGQSTIERELNCAATTRDVVQDLIHTKASPPGDRRQGLAARARDASLCVSSDGRLLNTVVLETAARGRRPATRT